ncbi:MAG: transporter [Legionella sp.]
MAEFNYIAQKLNVNTGTQQNYPSAYIRLGLPGSNELYAALPNYINQKSAPYSGTTNMYYGIKHTLYSDNLWIFAAEEILGPPSGSYAYGSHGWNSISTAIANYSLNDRWSIGAMIGLSRYSDAKINGGHYFNSINPDVIVSYAPNNIMSFYGEIYGQSKIAANQSAGLNFDTGVIMLLSANTLLNVSAGQQLYNYLGNVTHYINFGFDVML